MKTRLRIAALVVLVVVAVAASIFVPRFARQLRFFRVRQVEIVGSRYLDEAGLVRALGLRADASTLDRLDDVRAAVSRVPGVLAATVERRLPNTLRITVSEATPVARVSVADGVALVDSAGRILPFDASRVAASLPMAASDSATPRLLQRIMRSDPDLFATIQAARRDGGDVVLDVGARRIRLRPEADSEILDAVTEVLRFLNAHATEWREIDARYHSRLFVQKGSA